MKGFSLFPGELVPGQHIIVPGQLRRSFRWENQNRFAIWTSQDRNYAGGFLESGEHFLVIALVFEMCLIVASRDRLGWVNFMNVIENTMPL